MASSHLRNLNLQLVRICQVVCTHAKATAGNLLDGAAQRVANATRQRCKSAGVLSSLTAVALSTDRVHSEGEGGVRLQADGAIRHSASHKAAARGANRGSRCGVHVGEELWEVGVLEEGKV
jgi:hypothetical protein